MTDGQWLFVVFATLYLLECLRWVPLHAWLLTEKRGGRWNYLRPSKMLSARGRGLILLSPLPPFRAHLSVDPWLFIPERDHLLVLEETGSTSRLPWAELRLRADGSRLFLGMQSSIQLSSEESAEEWNHRLKDWAAMPQEEREADFLNLAKQSLDPESLSQSARSLSQRVRSLNANATVILFWCFGVVTGAYTWFGESPYLWGSVIVLFSLQLAQAILFWRSTRSSAGPPAVSYRFWKALSIAFLPHSSVRAADHLCQAAAQMAHPLAAHHLVATGAYLAVSQRFWRQARYGKGWTETKSLPLQAEALHRHFQSVGVQLSELEAPPTRDLTSRAYCPRCLTQFQLVTGECRDCDGTDLRAFE